MTVNLVVQVGIYLQPDHGCTYHLTPTKKCWNLCGMDVSMWNFDDFVECVDDGSILKSWILITAKKKNTALKFPKSTLSNHSTCDPKRFFWRVE